MATTYADNFTLSLAINYQNAVDIGTGKYAPTYTYQSIFADGNGNGQAELVWTDERTISASSNEDLDLYGSLTDHFGTTINGVTVKCIIVEAKSTNGDNITVGGASSNTFVGPFDHASDQVNVPPGGLFAWRAPNTGVSVTSGTGDLLRITNADSGADGVYKIIIVFTIS